MGPAQPPSQVLVSACSLHAPQAIAAAHATAGRGCTPAHLVCVHARGKAVQRFPAAVAAAVFDQRRVGARQDLQRRQDRREPMCSKPAGFGSRATGSCAE